MMHDNDRWNEFSQQLAARGVDLFWMWEARRDGKKPKWPKSPADVGMVAFKGRGFQPSVLVAVVIDYGPRDGFGLFVDSPNGQIAADVDMIATPNKAAA